MTIVLPVVVAATMLSAVAHAENWQPVRDVGEVRSLFSDTRMSTMLSDGVTATAEYRSDGTGTVQAWGDTFQRTWEVRPSGEVCIQAGDAVLCYAIERDTNASDRYRSTNLDTGEQLVLMISNTDQLESEPGQTTAAGAAAKPSAEEIAAKLANPNTPLASLTTKLQYRSFEGGLSGADGRDGTTLLLQPSFPFALKNGDLILFRPAIPILLDQPVVEADGFGSASGLGDIAFDLAYARTTDSGILIAGGIISSLPTATDDALGTDRWTLGPEFLIGRITKKHVLGFFPNHQWDIGGSGSRDVSLTTIQAFYTYLPGGGWNLGTAPIMSYDHISDQWTVPLNFTFGKTVIWNGRPWKLGAEINYYVERNDAFSPEWMIGINVAPVVENVLARWFR
jgi:hypothetical protein